MTRPPKPSELTMDRILRTRDSSYLHEHEAVFNLCDSGVLSLHLHDVALPTDAVGLEEWTRTHKGCGVADSGASDAHLSTKLTGAYWLDETGHKMPTVSVETADAIPSYRYAAECFEQPVDSHRGDVVCCCDGHDVVVEAGYTPPQRLLRAFGFRYYGNLSVETSPEHDGVVRVADVALESFCVAPYRFGGMSERPVFEFRPANLPTSELGVVGAEASRIVDE